MKRKDKLIGCEGIHVKLYTWKKKSEKKGITLDLDKAEMSHFRKFSDKTNCKKDI